jgi:hypothetical protein
VKARQLSASSSLDDVKKQIAAQAQSNINLNLELERETTKARQQVIS